MCLFLTYTDKGNLGFLLSAKQPQNREKPGIDLRNTDDIASSGQER